MSDKALQNALARRDTLAARINNAQKQMDLWRKELSRVEDFIKYWHELSDMGEVENELVFSAQGNKLISEDLIKKFNERLILKVNRNSKKEDVAEAARQIIFDRGSPISRTDLLKMLRKKGLVIDGSDPEMVLSTMLWRMKNRITRLKTGGYWLTEVPNAEVGYDPAESVDGAAEDDESAPNDGSEDGSNLI
jgi:hypothetical protein